MARQTEQFDGATSYEALTKLEHKDGKLIKYFISTTEHGALEQDSNVVSSQESINVFAFIEIKTCLIPKICLHLHCISVSSLHVYA